MSETQSYFIPIEQRIYVLEEIDAIGDIVKQRTEDDHAKSTVNDELTLMEILTVLDGTMEIPGRIVVMTSNHPEVLDKALIRPGRIDVKVHFGYSKRELIAEMFEAYFDMPFPKDEIHRLPDRMLSPAEVGQVLFKHFDTLSCEDVINDLNETVKTLGRLKQEPEIILQESNDVITNESEEVPPPDIPPPISDLLTPMLEEKTEKTTNAPCGLAGSLLSPRRQSDNKNTKKNTDIHIDDDYEIGPSTIHIPVEDDKKPNILQEKKHNVDGMTPEISRVTQLINGIHFNDKKSLNRLDELPMFANSNNDVSKKENSNNDNEVIEPFFMGSPYDVYEEVSFGNTAAPILEPNVPYNNTNLINPTGA
jgi:hypothetical protein